MLSNQAVRECFPWESMIYQWQSLIKFPCIHFPWMHLSPKAELLKVKIRYMNIQSSIIHK